MEALQAVNTLLWRRCPDIFYEDITGLFPIDKQRQLLRDLTDFNINRILVCAASGTGKTLLLAVLAEWHTLILPQIIKQPYKVAILAGSQRQADTLYQYILQHIQKSEWLQSQLAKEPLKSYVLWANQSSIISLPASPTAYHGLHPNLLIIDEAEDAAMKDEKLILDAPSRIAGMPYSRLILSATPYYGTIFCKYYYEEKVYPEWKRYHWTALDCPWISKQEIQWAKDHLPPSEFKIRWEGTFVEGPEEAMFRRKDILNLKIEERPRPVEDQPVILCIDWGYKPHPTGVIVLQKVGKRYIILEAELWKEITYPEQIKRIQALAERYKVTEVRADSEAIGECQRLKELGLPVKPISFRGNKPRMLEALRASVEEGRLTIWEGFSELLSELAYYHPKRGKGDDLVDALMLAMLEDITPYFDRYYFKLV